MELSEFVRKRISSILSSYAEGRIPERVRDQVKLGHRWEGNSVLLIESRPSFRDPTEWVESPIAKFRYVVSREEWQLYWMDRNLKWRIYDLVEPAKQFSVLLNEVERDPTCIFWG